MGLGTTVAFAGNLTSGVETVMAVNDFTPIEVKDLPAAITEAIAKNFAESIVKEAAVEATEDGSKTYQVVLTDKEGTENTVFFNEKGLSGNFWLVSFKISYLCLPLFYETRTTPSCHPSGCAYRQL